MATSRKQKGGMSRWRMAWGRVPGQGTIILPIAFFALLGILSLFPSCSSGVSKPPRSEAPGPAATPPGEFPSFAYNSARVLQAYKTAVQIPQVLPLMPCYCGCGEVLDHKNLKDCFFKEDDSLNDHGAFCEVCDMEVLDIAKWQEEGYSLEQIRELIDEKYPNYGEPTDTPPLAWSGTSVTPKLPDTSFTAGPRLAFDETSVKLGRVPQDIPINYTFHFKNAGNAPLKITNTWTKALVGC